MTASKTGISLALLWGHIPAGVIRTSRHVSRRDSGPVPFVLARNEATGRSLQSYVRSFGSYHIDTSRGPFPVSLVELRLVAISPSVPENVHAILHSLSLGFPIVGEQEYLKSEKFFNPAVPPPLDNFELQLQDWLSPAGGLLRVDSLSSKLLDYRGKALEARDSLLRDYESTGVGLFPGESSSCSYVSHPEASHVRRDRGKVKGESSASGSRTSGP
jgi:hypothetical protein